MWRHVRWKMLLYSLICWSHLCRNGLTNSVRRGHSPMNKATQPKPNIYQFFLFVLNFKDRVHGPSQCIKCWGQKVTVQGHGGITICWNQHHTGGGIQDLMSCVKLDFLIVLYLQPPVRQESCQGLYRLCRGRTSDGQTGYVYLLPILINLLPSLDEATAIKTPQKKVNVVY